MAILTYDDIEREWFNSQPYISARTSGSTGNPKDILLPKDLVRDSAERTIRFFSLNKDSHLHSCISPEFIGGKMMLIRSLLSGAKFSFESPSNRPVLTPEPISLLSIVPPQMYHLVQNRHSLPEVENYLIGGSSIPIPLCEEIMKAGLSAWESYGMTETASHIALRKIEYPQSRFSPLEGIEIDTDSRGCLIIKLPDHPVIVTNDIVEIDSSGKFVILGRADHVIISGGKKIHPVEVERIIYPLLSNYEFIITSRKDKIWGEALLLLIACNEDIDTTRLHTAMRELLPGYSVPKEIIVVDELPKTSSGKVIRRKLS